MRPFGDYLSYEERRSDLRDEQWRLERDCRRQRETRKLRRILLNAYLFGFALLLLSAALLVIVDAGEPNVETVHDARTPAAAVHVVAISAPEPAEPEDFENEKIEAALVESGYFRDDVPLDYDTQALLRSACEESGIEYELALAVIWRETTFRNVVGDDGNSHGYMQVQPRWHRDRMARLGVVDLMDPYGNFRVACDYLAELLGKYELAEALTFYNTGSPGHNQYADDVIGYLEELR